MAGQDDDNRARRDQARAQFNLLFIILQVIGLLMIVCVLFWILTYLGGFGWSDSLVRFNFHPICMTLGMVYMAGNSILAFRFLRDQPKPMVKLIHGGLHVSAFVISLFGSVAVFSFHLDQNIPNLYSLHSWLGATTMTLFFIQYFGAFYNFLYPGTSGQFRAWLLPYHVLGGFCIFMLAIASCLTGFTEKAIFLKSPQYSLFTGATFSVNFAGVLMVLFALLVLYLGTERDFRRVFVPEQRPLTNKSRDSSMQLDSSAGSPQ